MCCRIAVASSLLLVAGLAVADIATPLGVKTCADDQPNVVECRRKALQDAVPHLATGIPQMGATPIDPMDELPPLTWQTNSRGLALKFRLDNARFTGLGRSVVDNLQVDNVNNRIRVVTHIDGVNALEGAYAMSGKVLGVPLDGSGSFKVSMRGGNADVTYAGHLETADGDQSYLKVDSVNVKLDLGQSQYELTGLFGNYKPLVNAGNMFINSVATKVVQPELLPTLEKWLAEVYRQRAQAVFSTVPYDQLFPKRSVYSDSFSAV
ncbi:putative beta-carotene-binding protein isoform X2 [Schistocerca serialis cubense]|uniref:putative beta-carotene-binding protein isoform X2 n=1 Tax=Schistocerca serialis cubense TaxID=2023355 RepID=UPI00214E6CC4|nr:putative beta-carotene-binding protein isoform X2 [Schistocerca serialis cubense]